MTLKLMGRCVYVNRHTFCPQCGKENPKVCGLEVEETIVVETPDVEPEKPKVTPIAETLTFSNVPKPTRGRGKR